MLLEVHENRGVFRNVESESELGDCEYCRMMLSACKEEFHVEGG